MVTPVRNPTRRCISILPPKWCEKHKESLRNLLCLWKTLRLTEAHFLTEDNIAGILESWQGASRKVTCRREEPLNLSVSVTGWGEKVANEVFLVGNSQPG